jgi:hypothetical protein
MPSEAENGFIFACQLSSDLLGFGSSAGLSSASDAPAAIAAKSSVSSLARAWRNGFGVKPICDFSDSLQRAWFTSPSQRY